MNRNIWNEHAVTFETFLRYKFGAPKSRGMPENFQLCDIYFFFPSTETNDWKLDVGLTACIEMKTEVARESIADDDEVWQWKELASCCIRPDGNDNCVLTEEGWKRMTRLVMSIDPNRNGRKPTSRLRPNPQTFFRRFRPKAAGLCPQIWKMQIENTLAMNDDVFEKHALIINFAEKVIMWEHYILVNEQWTILFIEVAAVTTRYQTNSRM